MLKSKIFIAAILAAAAAFFIFTNNTSKKDDLPLIAIANYGPHSSLIETIAGLKKKLADLGYIEDKTVRYEISDVNFETSMILQMFSKLKSHRPKIIVVLSTPIAQAAKNTIKDIPIVYADVTDPAAAGLISNDIHNNITGASDKQDVSLVLKLAKDLIPNAKKLGVLYSIGEANDAALVKMLEQSAKTLGLEVISVPVEHSRDASTRMMAFKGNVDFIYTGSSGGIQAALPAIAAAADAMSIPLFNFNADEVKSNLALASFGVSHRQVGSNAAILVDKILKGENPGSIAVMHPKISDHSAYINLKKAHKLGIIIPKNLPQNPNVVE